MVLSNTTMSCALGRAGGEGRCAPCTSVHATAKEAGEVNGRVGIDADVLEVELVRDVDQGPDMRHGFARELEVLVFRVDLGLELDADVQVEHGALARSIVLVFTRPFTKT